MRQTSLVPHPNYQFDEQSLKASNALKPVDPDRVEANQGRNTCSLTSRSPRAGMAMDGVAVNKHVAATTINNLHKAKLANPSV